MAKKEKSVVALDLSTVSSGYAVFLGKDLLKHGIISPKVPGLHKMNYPKSALYKSRSMSNQIMDLISLENPDVVVIEEINRGVNRISQKSLDGLHFLLLNLVYEDNQDQEIVYVDSNGPKGWRTGLGLKLSKEDKKINSKIRKNGNKKFVINWKVLAQRHVNSKFNMHFDVLSRNPESDVVDAICIGDYYVNFL